MAFHERALELFFKTIERLTLILDLKSHSQRILLMFELAISLLVAVFVLGFMLHDLFWLILSWLVRRPGEYYAFKVFVVGMLVTVLSLVAIVIDAWSPRV